MEEDSSAPPQPLTESGIKFMTSAPPQQPLGNLNNNTGTTIPFEGLVKEPSSHSVSRQSSKGSRRSVPTPHGFAALDQTACERFREFCVAHNTVRNPGEGVDLETSLIIRPSYFDKFMGSSSSSSNNLWKKALLALVRDMREESQGVRSSAEEDSFNNYKLQLEQEEGELEEASEAADQIKRAAASKDSFSEEEVAASNPLSPRSAGATVSSKSASARSKQSINSNGGITSNTSSSFETYGARLTASEKTRFRFFSAVSGNDIETVREILFGENAYHLLRAEDEHRFLCLHWACSLGHLDVVKLLLEVDPEGQLKHRENTKKYTPFLRAAVKDHVEICEYLVREQDEKLLGAVDYRGRNVLQLPGMPIRTYCFLMRSWGHLIQLYSGVSGKSARFKEYEEYKEKMHARRRGEFD